MDRLEEVEGEGDEGLKGYQNGHGWSTFVFDCERLEDHLKNGVLELQNDIVPNASSRFEFVA